MSDDQVMSIQPAQAARDAAFTAFENVEAAIKSAKAAMAAHTPAAAVASGASLADTAKAQSEARHQLEFYQEAKAAAWQAVVDADAALKNAHVHATWSGKLKVAIQARIRATAEHEAAIAAAGQAETDYEAATHIIAEAFAHGMPKPEFLRENPLHLPPLINHQPRMQMRPAVTERELWGQS